MSKTKAPREFGPTTPDEYAALPQEESMQRAKRAYEKLMALKGKVHLDIDIDELRGRNRPTLHSLSWD